MDPYAALADPQRRWLLERLAHGPTRVADLAAARDISRPAVSRHLRVLSEAGLVSAEDRGRERHYALRAAGLADVRAYLDGLVAGPRIGARALDALATEVRRTTRQRRSTPAPPAHQEETA